MFKKPGVTRIQKPIVTKISIKPTEGILGKITKIGDQFLVVTLNDSMKVKVQVSAISNVLPKGTINSI